MEGQAPAGAKQDRTKINRTKQQLHKKGELNYGYEYWRLSRIRKQVQDRHQGPCKRRGRYGAIAELETFEVSIDGNTVEWSPMERG